MRVACLLLVIVLVGCAERAPKEHLEAYVDEDCARQTLHCPASGTTCQASPACIKTRPKK